MPAGPKIKRFLLRYDPPGIGLELEEHDVRHKDLPANGEVKCTQDILVLVEQIISSEPDLLSKRRHRPALMQLIGRLYNVEVETEAEDGDNASPLKQPARPDRPEAKPHASLQDEGVQEGNQVVLVGLKGKLQVHNGETATVTKASATKDKFEVLLANKLAETTETLKVKGVEHLIRLAPKGSFVIGMHVAIRGLRNHPELNGCLGRVVECHEESHRYEVRAIESGQLFRVKQENLLAVEATALPVTASKENREPNTASAPAPKVDSSLPPAQAPGGDAGGEFFDVGATVQLVDLKTATSYNGCQAEVISVDRSKGRYEIRLGDGSLKTIRSENIRLCLDGKSKPKYRGP